MYVGFGSDHASLEVGALLEAAGVAVHAVQRADYAVSGRAVLVSGGGPVGLVVAHLAKLMGAAHVIVVEPSPLRRGRPGRLDLPRIAHRRPRRTNGHRGAHPRRRRVRR